MALERFFSCKGPYTFIALKLVLWSVMNIAYMLLFTCCKDVGYLEKYNQRTGTVITTIRFEAVNLPKVTKNTLQMLHSLSACSTVICVSSSRLLFFLEEQIAH